MSKKNIGIIVSGIGSIMSIVSLSIFYLYSIPQIPIIRKLALGLISILGISSFPAIAIPITGIVMLALGLISILGISSFPAIAIPITGIVMLAFGLISILHGYDFFILFSSLPLLLIFISGLIYILSSILLFRLRNWQRKLIIAYSIIIIIYFISLFIYLTISGAWRNFFGGALAFSLLPYILFPLFFIIFLTIPKIKEQFKK